jgi:DNA-binding MarR family transcriptional regulator
VLATFKYSIVHVPTSSIVFAERRKYLMMTGNIANKGQLALGSLESLLGLHLKLAQSTMHRQFRLVTSSMDLTQQQCATLCLIEANPGVSPVDLASALMTDRTSISVNLDILEQRDLVVRMPSRSDRRRQELNLTLLGRRVLAKAKRLIALHESVFVSQFSERELEVLVENLQRIHRH